MLHKSLILVLVVPFLFLAGCTGAGEEAHGGDGHDDGHDDDHHADDSGNKKFTGKEDNVFIVKVIQPAEYRFSPDRLEVGTGETVGIQFENGGKLAHEFSIRDAGFHLHAAAGETLKAGFTAPSEPGEYEFACFVPGHYEQGMKGTLVVT